VRIPQRALLVVPLLCAGGPAAVTGCGDGTGPSCAKQGQHCDLFTACCPGLSCGDTPTDGLQCQKPAAAAASWQVPPYRQPAPRSELRF
jgi:hypothetical protein